MRFEVPQFIEVEDKIIGPLTWKQFVYIAGGAGILIILYLSDIPFIFFVLIGLPVAALSGSLAFHKINNRPFSLFLESLVTYFSKQKLYTWKKKEMQVITEKTTRVDTADFIDGAQPSPRGRLNTAELLNDL